MDLPLPEVVSPDIISLDYTVTHIKTRGRNQMIKNPRTRRASAIILVVLGAILMLLAPEVWQGALLLILGVVLELVGIALEHKDDRASR